MFISYMSINQMVEEQAAKDGDYRAVLGKSGRPLLSHGRTLSDDTLLAKLHSLGLDVQRQRLLDIIPCFISAQEAAEEMIERASSSIPDSGADWVWIAITCLWERWQPELPNTEMVNDKMQAGYAALKAGDVAQACRLWLETWRAILDIMQRGSMDSLDAFDDLFGGTQSVFNWVQDMETELHNAGLREPHFLRERIALCETMVDRFDGGHLTLGNFKRALAESHFESGNREIGDRLFRRWLDEQPQWGWGWIGWSDCYWLFALPTGEKDATRAEQILKEGLAASGVEDRSHILERLAVLYDGTGRGEEAESVREEIKRLTSTKRTTKVSRSSTSIQIKLTFDFGDEGLPLEQLPNLTKSLRPANLPAVGPFATPSKIGRNEPCPCGSGKKFKKCCGSRGPTP
ncbi:MAG: SEC-C metal-binding domain-containing protein [Planctomycetota bacterium]